MRLERERVTLRSGRDGPESDPDYWVHIRHWTVHCPEAPGWRRHCHHPCQVRGHCSGEGGWDVSGGSCSMLIVDISTRTREKAEAVRQELAPGPGKV